jgi:hypothetical protein
MPVSPTVIVTNFESGATLTGVFPADADGPALSHDKYIQMAGGQVLHTRPMTSGGAIMDPAGITYELVRRMSGKGLFSPTGDFGGQNQFGYSVSQVTVNCPGVTATVLEIVDDFADPTEVIAEALTVSPLPDGHATRFTAPIANDAVMPNTLALRVSTGETFVDDGNGVLVRYGANGREERGGPRVGHVRYGVGPIPSTSEVVFEFDVAPPIGATIEADYWYGAASSVMPFFDPATATPALPVDQFVWGRGRDDGPILLTPGQYLRVSATGALGGAGSITALVGGALPRGLGTNVYGFANRKRAI